MNRTIQCSMKLSAAFLCILLASGCTPAQHSDDSAAETDAQTAAVTEAAATETAAGTEKSEPVYDYVHGEDGYFSLPDSGLGTPVKLQKDGTCWVVSASTAIESGTLVRSGKTMEADPDALLDSVYNDDRQEGWFLADNLSKRDFGGWGWMIVEALADGIDGKILTEANDFAGCDPETLKEAIRTMGAVSIGVPDRQSAKGYFGNYQTVNDPEVKEQDYDHNVTIVGWDDHFPKDYFRNKAESDGAWLIQNSISEKYAYYWLSYETPFLTPYDFAVSGDYGEVVAYDCGKENKLNTGDETCIANVFHHPGTLAAVGTYSCAENQHFTIEIRDAAMENVLYSQEAQYPFRGYHLTELETPQDVTDYAVVIRFTGEAPVEGDGFSDEFVSFRASAEKGQSFVLIGDQWADLSQPDTAKTLGLDFTPNNACIKAVYAK